MEKITSKVLEPDETLELSGEILVGHRGVDMFRGGNVVIQDAVVKFAGGQIYDPGTNKAEILFENVQFDGSGPLRMQSSSGREGTVQQLPIPKFLKDRTPR